MRSLGGRTYSLGRQRNLVWSLPATLRYVLDGAAREAGLRSEANRLCDFKWFVGVPIFQISTDRNLSSSDQGGSVRKHRFPIDRSISLTNRECKSRARSGERLQSERLQQSRSPGIPRIRNDETAISLMQRAEDSSFFCLRRHWRLHVHSHGSGC